MADLKPGDEGTIYGLYELCKFIEENNCSARFRGNPGYWDADVVILTKRAEPQPEPSVVEFARSLAEASPASASTETASPAATGEMPITLGKPVTVYADGGVITDPVTKQFNPSPIGGTWAWCHVDESGQRINGASGFLSVAEAKVPKGVTNNLTEIYALLLCLEALPADWVGTVCSDSKVSLGRLFGSFSLNELPGWLIERIGQVLRNHRMDQIRYVLLDGHPTRAQLDAGVGKRGHPVSEHNVWCDTACNEAKEYALKGLGLA